MDIKAIGSEIEKFVSKLTTPRLKDLIKSIRACKTAADERAVIAKESANIRTAFKEENIDLRHINVAKLLYIHMLGYPAQFGQIECLKLVASPRFADKRLGYLGIMLLLDENQETLTLVTNCLKNDMNNPNVFTVGLALCTLGNISSPEMARDLCSEVERLLGNSNSYIRKKAALCALRIIKKVPDLLENFISRGATLLNERNHGVLLTGITLLTEMCEMSPEVLSEVRKNVPALVRHLKNLVTAGFSPEHDVSGITDPFLQVKILRLLRLAGKGDAEASDVMNDILAQVATNIDASKNVGNAVLYETVLTIMETESENSLRVLGINILGKFLSNKDNNIRYVALTTLAKISNMASSDSSPLQRHRAIILECLRDPDVSIRRRATDLTFFLINGQNVRLLTRELLSFLEVCESDVKASVASRICDVAGRYRPNKRWELDTVIRVLKVAGAFVEQSVVNYFVKLVSTGPSNLYAYAARKLFGIVKNEGDKALSQDALVQAAVWCIGEYGDLLVQSMNDSLSALAGDEEDTDPSQTSSVTEAEVVEFFDSLLKGNHATNTIKEYSITALIKLTARFRESGSLNFAKSIIARYSTSIQMELQQRSVEYTVLANLGTDSRQAFLERVPVLESATKEEAKKGTGAALTDASPARVPSGVDDLVGLSDPAPRGGSNDILGLLDSAPAPSAKPQSGGNIMDLLGGLGLGDASPAAAPPKPAAVSSGTDILGDIFGAQSTPVPSGKSYSCYSKNDLSISLVPQPRAPGTPFVEIVAYFSNSGLMTPISDLLFQIAVPKSLKLTLQPATSSVVLPGKQETQKFKIENPGLVPIKLRLKIRYACATGVVEEIVEFSGFDASVYA